MPRPFLPLPPPSFLLMLAIISVSAVEKQLQCGDHLFPRSQATLAVDKPLQCGDPLNTYFLAVRRVSRSNKT